MKSFQNWPGTSGSSGGGARRIVASSNPLASKVPANDSSTTNTTRCPRSLRTLPIPTQLFVGPNAPSGKNTIVFGSVTLALHASDRAHSLGGPTGLSGPADPFRKRSVPFALPLRGALYGGACRS